MLVYVIEDLMETIQLNGLQSVIGGTLFAVGYLIIRFLHLQVSGIGKRLNGGGLFCKYMFVCYLMYVFYLVLLSREPGSRVAVNLALLGTYSESPRAQAYMFENILLLIPFGFLLPLLSKGLRGFTSVLGLGLAFSLTIEVLQYITQRGYFQIDDIWLNTLGAATGYCIAFFLLQIRKIIGEQL